MKTLVSVYEIDIFCRNYIENGKTNLVQAYLIDNENKFPPNVDMYYMVEDRAPYRAESRGHISV